MAPGAVTVRAPGAVTGLSNIVVRIATLLHGRRLLFRLEQLHQRHGHGFACESERETTADADGSFNFYLNLYFDNNKCI